MLQSGWFVQNYDVFLEKHLLGDCFCSDSLETLYQEPLDNKNTSTLLKCCKNRTADP